MFRLYQAAGGPPLREIEEWIRGNDELKGSVSTETIRRILRGQVPPQWHTVEAIALAFYTMSDMEPGEERYPDSMGDPFTNLDATRRTWAEAIEEDPDAPTRAPVGPRTTSTTSHRSDAPEVPAPLSRPAMPVDRPANSASTMGPRGRRSARMLLRQMRLPVSSTQSPTSIRYAEAKVPTRIAHQSRRMVITLTGRTWGVSVQEIR